ncbi:hypothetical protein D3C87_1368940 [compost metagenome]
MMSEGFAFISPNSFARYLLTVLDNAGSFATKVINLPIVSRTCSSKFAIDGVCCVASLMVLEP